MDFNRNRFILTNSVEIRRKMPKLPVFTAVGYLLATCLSNRLCGFLQVGRSFYVFCGSVKVLLEFAGIPRLILELGRGGSRNGQANSPGELWALHKTAYLNIKSPTKVLHILFC